MPTMYDSCSITAHHFLSKSSPSIGGVKSYFHYCIKSTTTVGDLPEAKMNQKNIWPRSKLLVSRCHCCLWGKAKHQLWFSHYHKLPQVWVTDILVSTICLLSRSPPPIVWRMFIYESRFKKHRQIKLISKPTPGITERLQNLMITFFLSTLVRGQCSCG